MTDSQKVISSRQKPLHKEKSVIYTNCNGQFSIRIPEMNALIEKITKDGRKKMLPEIKIRNDGLSRRTEKSSPVKKMVRATKSIDFRK